MGRLGGPNSHRKIEAQTIDQLFVWKLASMHSALPCVDTNCWFWKYSAGSDKWNTYQSIKPRVDGVKDRLDRANSMAEKLIEDAISIDPRLGQKRTWRRSDDGEFVDIPSWLSQDDNPWFRRTVHGFTDRAATGDPVRVVISTDSKDPKPESAAAFIATARLVMQFKPLEIWWQGAWLNQTKSMGFVFHVPLVTNEVDFSRLEFCIADPDRDSLSFCVMIAKVVETKRGNHGCGHPADHSYLADTTVFVPHDGIGARGNDVACAAARWLGWEDHYSVQWEQRAAGRAALQDVEFDPKPVPHTSEQETAKARAEREKYWKKRDEEIRKQNQQLAEERMKAV